MLAIPLKPGKFVISLDFELLWGVRDHADRNSYGQSVLGAREAIPRMLELFEKHGIAATWATVGFVFCSSRDELMASLPPKDYRPSYDDARLSSYAYLDEVGPDETHDPHYFGASLIERIRQTPRQEIATHTLSHYYCLEAGQTEAQFTADLEAAITLAQARGISLKSIVFPRNQYAASHLAICHRLGLTSYRGTPAQWIYRSVPGRDQTPTRRAGRLIDAHTGLFGDTSFGDDVSALANVPASHFLRPVAGRLKAFHPLHRRSIQRDMSRAARAGRGYHLWWHPHNFGRDMEANLGGLEDTLTHYLYLRDEYGMRSCSMAEAAE